MNQAEFLAFWTVLCERHRMTPSAPLTRMYALTFAAERMTAQEWATAAAASLRFDDFFPSPQRLIDYARPGIKAQALAEWDACLDRAAAGEAATLPGTEARRIMNRVTNGVPLGDVTTDRLPWLKKEFLEQYAEHLTTQAKQRTPALDNGPQAQELSYVD